MAVASFPPAAALSPGGGGREAGPSHLPLGVGEHSHHGGGGTHTSAEGAGGVRWAVMGAELGYMEKPRWYNQYSSN